MVLGWTAPMQPLLQAQANIDPLNVTISSSFWDSKITTMTDEEVSWIGGALCLAGTFGTPCFGYLANLIGRKRSILFASVPFILSYILILFATSPMYVYASRTLAGLGGSGILAVLPMYIAETAEDRVRGILSSFLNLFVCSGILAGYVIGSYTSYMLLAFITLAFMLLFVVLSVWLPESPVYSLINNRPEEALQALTKLRGSRNKEAIQQQLSVLTTAVKEMASNNTRSMSLKEMLRDPPTRKGLIIALTICTVQQAAGITPILTYTVVIFQLGGSDLSPSIAAIIVGALQIVGAIIGTLLMDKAGRKILLMVSSVGMALSLTPIAYFLYLKNHGGDPSLLESIGWVPVTSLAVYIVVYGLGFGPVPYVLVSELFKTEAKSLATSICIAQLWITSFFYVKFFSNIVNAVGIDTCFAIFAVCCAAGAVFTFFYVIETKGKSVDTILHELGGYSQPDSRSSPVPFLDTDNNNLALKTPDKV